MLIEKTLVFLALIGRLMILWWHVVYTSQSFGRVYQTLPVVIDLAQICAVSQARLIPSALVVMAKSAKPEWASNPLALTKSQASLLLKLGAPLLLLLAENINDINSLDIFPPVFFSPNTAFYFQSPCCRPCPGYIYVILWHPAILGLGSVPQSKRMHV